jgi:hypothetical protein
VKTEYEMGFKNKIGVNQREGLPLTKSKKKIISAKSFSDLGPEPF